MYSRESKSGERAGPPFLSNWKKYFIYYFCNIQGFLSSSILHVKNCSWLTKKKEEFITLKWIATTAKPPSTSLKKRWANTQMKMKNIDPSIVQKLVQKIAQNKCIAKYCHLSLKQDSKIQKLCLETSKWQCLWHLGLTADFPLPREEAMCTRCNSTGYLVIVVSKSFYSCIWVFISINFYRCLSTVCSAPMPL